MKCNKCQAELVEESKFCNSCGNKIEEKEKSLSESMNDTLKEAGLMWFTVGLVKGNCLNDKKTKKWFKEVFEKDMLKNPKFAEHYEYINSEYNKMFPQSEKLTQI